VLTDAAGDGGRFLVAFVRNGRLLARVRTSHWGPAHELQRAVGRAHWQLLAAAFPFGGMQVAWVRHRFTRPGHPGARQLFAAGVRSRWTSVQRLERDNAVAPGFFPGTAGPILAYVFGPNSHAVPRIRLSIGVGRFGPALDAAPPQGGVRSVSVASVPLVVGWVVPNPSGDGGGIGYAAAPASGSTFGPREQVTPNEAAFDMHLVNEPEGVRAFWTARPEGTGPSVPVSQVRTFVRTAVRTG
jgi:hypothetical protein